MDNAAEEATEAAIEREPLDSDRGFCAYGDAPGGIGGGTSAFHWYESREKMLEFIAEHALFMNLPRGDLDLDAIQEGISSTIKAMRCGRIDDATALPKINELLRHASQFTWLGTFGSLRQGETEAARNVLKEFRDSQDGTPAGPVGEEELEDFRQFLRDYCIG